jgi:hypothetical protein
LRKLSDRRAQRTAPRLRALPFEGLAGPFSKSKFTPRHLCRTFVLSLVQQQRRSQFLNTYRRNNTGPKAKNNEGKTAKVVRCGLDFVMEEGKGHSKGGEAREENQQPHNYPNYPIIHPGTHHAYGYAVDPRYYASDEQMMHHYYYGMYAHR